jgi:hypothetical protein
MYRLGPEKARVPRRVVPLEVFTRFLARLASIPSLDELSEGQQMLLLEEYWKLIKEVDAEEQSRRVVISGFRDLHQHARELIVGLLEGRNMSPPVAALPDPVWRLQGREVQERWVPRRAADSLLADLIGIVRKKPFPFAFCPLCHTVFVRVRRQRYCSPICTYRATEAARREKKKAYMKEYMAKRRKQTAQRRKER